MLKSSLLGGAALATLTRLTLPQTVVPLAPEAWNGSDSIRFETYLGRPSVYINRGVALVRNLAAR